VELVVRGIGIKKKRSGDLTERDVLDSARAALKSAGLKIDPRNAHHIGLFIGTAFFNLQQRRKFFADYTKGGIRMVNPAEFPGTLISCLGSNICISLGIKGANVTVSSGDSAGGDALVAARYFLERNKKNIALVVELAEKIVRAGEAQGKASTCRVFV